MRYPEVNERVNDTYVQSAFGGYNGRERIGEGEFAEMENMSSRGYPLLRPREKRGNTPDVYANDFGGGFVADSPFGEVYGVLTAPNINNESFIRLHESTGHKCGAIYDIEEHKGEQRQFATMGAEVIMFPDKMKLSFDGKDYFGVPKVKFDSLENETVVSNVVPSDFGNIGYFMIDKVPLSDDDGGMLIKNLEMWRAENPPADPANGDLWLDRTNRAADPYNQNTGQAVVYSEIYKTWVNLYPTYVKLRYPGIGKGFKAGDYVSLTVPENAGPLIALKDKKIIEACGDDFIVVQGIIDYDSVNVNTVPQSHVGITVKRSVPDLDYITEAGNRLWGCRNEYRDGKIINEIYVSALGDPTNWSKYDGITSDSYAVTIGIGGAFTGAATYSDVPHFFKENAIIKVYGNAPSNYETVALRCDGVEEGSARSIVNVDGRLFYKSRRGLMVYGGGYPSLLTDKFGETRYCDAVGGELHGKYYVSMKDESGKRHLFVYDTAAGLLHREDDIPVSMFLRGKSKLIALNGKYITVMNPEGETLEGDVEWSVTTGELGLDDPDSKYFSRIKIRANIPLGAYFTVSFRYGSRGNFIETATFYGEGLGTCSYLVQPTRCDTMEMRLHGVGDVRIYSIAYNYERGTDA